VLEKNPDSAMHPTRMPISQGNGMSSKTGQPQCLPSSVSSTSLLPK
jgi:hypothetical protein